MKASYSSILAVLFASSSSLVSADSALEQCFPHDLPWFTFEGNDYIFSRSRYNSVCVDSHGHKYQSGKIEGIYPPIDEPDSGCSAACVSGYGRGRARGCTSMKPDKLVGFNYNCNEHACYCLYERNTWSDEDSPCFDSMDISNRGQGDVYDTQVEVGSTCYSLYVQPVPAPTPGPPPGSSICTRTPDYRCYKTGRPACCSVDDGENCPSEMTICDNHGEDMTGTSYCTSSPDYQCYKGGWPDCCVGIGGDVMNCPREQPPCDGDLGGVFQAVKHLRASRRK